MARLVLIRGVSGSGKTTLANQVFSDFTLVEENQFFIDEGVFLYDSSKVLDSQEWCLERTKKELAAGKNVVVANTFESISKVSSYVNIGYPVTIIRATGNFSNKHNFPESVLTNQMEVFEDIENEIITTPALLRSRSVRNDIRNGLQPESEQSIAYYTRSLALVDKGVKSYRSRKKYLPQMDFIPLNGNTNDHQIPFYLNEYLEPIEPFIQFMIDIGSWKYENNKRSGRFQAYKSFINQYAYALKQLAVFLYEKKMTWDKVDDKSLKDWYDWDLKKTIKSNVSSGDVKTAQRTVNRKIAALYKFYGWAQYNGFLKPGYVSKNGGKITSTIMEAYNKGLLNGPLVRVSPINNPEIINGLYPLRQERAGEPNKDYGLKDSDIERAYDCIGKANCSEYIKERNILLIDIIHQVGLRPDMVASLRASQFNWTDIEEATDNHVLIKPDRQKLSYDDYFEVSLSLCARILNFIEGERTTKMKTLALTEKKVSNSLFITEPGRPMSAQRISDALNSYGIRPYALRHKFSDDRVYEELSYRARLGMPVDPLTVLQSVGQSLGHKNINSQKSYHKANSKIRSDQLEARLSRQNAELLGELHEKRKTQADLEAEIRKLKKELEKD